MMIRRTVLATLVVLLAAAVPADAQRSRTPTQKSSDDNLLTMQKRTRTLESRVVALERQIARLTDRLEKVESQAADASTDVVGFTEQGSSIVVERGGARLQIGPGGVTLEGTSVSLKGSGSTTIEAQGAMSLKAGGSATLETPGTLNLKGTQLRLNGGSKPIATQGSQIAGASPGGPVAGQVVTGSATVLVP